MKDEVQALRQNCVGPCRSQRGERAFLLGILLACWLWPRPAAAQGAFVTTGRLTEARYGATATLLTDGRVFVFGGNGVGFLDTAEIYDPTNGTWARAAGGAVRRTDHTATLLPDGRILVVGGVGAIGAALSSGEIYDPDQGPQGTWTSTGESLQAARHAQGRRRS